MSWCKDSRSTASSLHTQRTALSNHQAHHLDSLIPFTVSGPSVLVWGFLTGITSEIMTNRCSSMDQGAFPREPCLLQL